MNNTVTHLNYNYDLIKTKNFLKKFYFLVFLSSNKKYIPLKSNRKKFMP